MLVPFAFLARSTSVKSAVNSELFIILLICILILLYKRNKVNYDIATMKINIKNKDSKRIVEDILKKYEFKDIL